MNDLSPYESFERVLRRWWVVAACMVIGGMLGWGLSFLLRPIYEARANYLVQIDAEQLARLRGFASSKELDFSQINPYYMAAEEIFYDMDTRKALVEQAQAEGIPLTLKEFSQSKFYVDRQGNRWIVLVRDSDPEGAAWLANAWLTLADRRIREAQAHGIQADVLQAKVNAVQSCFVKLDFAAANQCAGTDFSGPEDLQSFLQDSMTQHQTEARLSLGVSPLLTLTIQREATPPPQPVLQIRSQIALAGALTGLILGTLLVHLLPERGAGHA